MENTNSPDIEPDSGLRSAPDAPDTDIQAPIPSRIQQLGKTYGLTLLLLGLTFWYLANPGFGFAIFWLIPAFLIHSMWRHERAVRDPSKRDPTSAVRFTMWTTMYAAVIGLHFYYQYAFNEAGHGILSKVLEFKAQHGEYPQNLGKLGGDIEALAKSRGVHYYSREGRHDLYVESGWIIYSWQVYDFQTGTWHTHSW